MVKVIELTPTDGHKSFYGKARVIIESDGKRFLQSYNSICCSIDGYGNVHRFEHKDSQTTRRHIKSFCNLTSKEYFKIPIEDCPSISL